MPFLFSAERHAKFISASLEYAEKDMSKQEYLKQVQNDEKTNFGTPFIIVI